MSNRIVIKFLILSLALGFVPLTPGQAESHPEILPREMQRFVMTVKWGNVQGEPVVRDQADFDGSVTVSSGQVGIVRPLQFEKHDEAKDQLTSRQNPVSWTSWIYGHWDGVRVIVTAAPEATIEIKTAAGNYSALVSEITKASAPLVHDLGSGREIVINSHSFETRQFGLRVYWGDPHKRENLQARVKVQPKARLEAENSGSSAGPAASGGIALQQQTRLMMETDSDTGRQVDFSGSLTAGHGAALKFKQALRFESSQGDKIISENETAVVWNSFIAGGVDGVWLLPRFEAGAASDDMLVVNFSQLGWSKEFNLAKVFAQGLTKERIQTDAGATYVLALEVVRRPHGSLLRDPRDKKVYRLEDDELQPVLSPAAFSANELSWSDVETVTAEEIDSYAIGEPLPLPDGELVRSVSDPAVLVATEGCFRPFINTAAFFRLGYDFANVTVLPDGDVRAFKKCEMVTETSDHSNGALLRAANEMGVYQIRGGRRHPIRSREVFDTHRLSFDNVNVVNRTVLDQYSESTDLEPAEGALVQAQGESGIYVIDGGEKRLLSAEQSVDALMMTSQAEVVTLPTAQLDALTSGDIVAAIE